MKLNLESLCDRTVPSATLSGGTLLVTVDGNAPVHTVSIDTVGSQTQVTEDGVATLFNTASITNVVVVGDTNSSNVIQNNTSLTSVLLGGKKDDTLFGGTGVNVIDAGKGEDVVYALLGSNTINTSGDKFDRVFTNAGASVTSDAADLVVRFFGTGRAPNSGFIGFDPQLNDGVLYITPTGNGSSVVLTGGPNGSVVATYDLGDGKGLQVATFANVKAISYFGGSGNDVYVNQTKIQEAVYGGAGNDLMVGGVGDFSIMKGSGGDDVLIARAKQVDVSGNGGKDTIVFTNPNSEKVIRSNATDDVVIGAKKRDTFIIG